MSSRILGLDSLTMNVIIISDFQVSHDEGLKHRFSESLIKKLPFGRLNQILRRTPGGTDIHS